MSKTKEVAHHYLGSKCKIKYANDKNETWTNEVIDLTIIGMLYTGAFSGIRLQLIPLEEMTMEHKIEFAELFVKIIDGFTDEDDAVHFTEIIILGKTFTSKTFTAEELAWLLAHSYDVFNLIPDGEADNLLTKNPK